MKVQGSKRPLPAPRFSSFLRGSLPHFWRFVSLIPAPAYPILILLQTCGISRFRLQKRRQHMKFGYFDDAAREYVITTPKTPLPWINYLGCNDFFLLAGLKHLRRLQLLPGRQADAPDALPLQQRPLRFQRKILLHPGREHCLEPRLAADADRFRLLRMPSRHRLFKVHLREKRPEGFPHRFRSDG